LRGTSQLSPTFPANGSTAFSAPRDILLDIDSSVSLTRGEIALRLENVYSASGWEDVLKLIATRYRGKLSRIYFRTYAGFGTPDVCEYLEAMRIKYAIQPPTNSVLQEELGDRSSQFVTSRKRPYQV
jgi:hypothetical protein